MLQRATFYFRASWNNFFPWNPPPQHCCLRGNPGIPENICIWNRIRGNDVLNLTKYNPRFNIIGEGVCQHHRCCNILPSCWSKMFFFCFGGLFYLMSFLLLLFQKLAVVIPLNSIALEFQSLMQQKSYRSVVNSTLSTKKLRNVELRNPTLTLQFNSLQFPLIKWATELSK